MSYNIGKGSLYVGNVKWSSDYKNVMLFASSLDNDNDKSEGKTKRNNFMKNHLTKIKSNVIWYDPNQYVDIQGRIKKIDSVNYCYYEPDTDILDTPLCCFVTGYQYMSANTTRLFLSLDVWQTYIYDTNLYQSYIERAIISKSLDAPLYNTLPEPISAQCDVQHELNDDTEGDGILSDEDWSPRWVLHSASHYYSADGKYHYEGNGTENTFGEYGCYVDSVETMQKIIKHFGRQGLGDTLNQMKENIENVGDTIAGFDSEKWSNLILELMGVPVDDPTISEIMDMLGKGFSVAQYQDHRDELIGLYAVPKWVIDKAQSKGETMTDLDNRVLDKECVITLNQKHLAVKNNDGTYYTPRNKKILSSVCRCYVLANRTGLKIPFKPELFTSSKTTLTLRGIAMSTSGYQYRLSNYSDEQTAYGEVAYNSERRVGFDNNTGLNKTLALIGAGTQLVEAGASLGGAVASGNAVATVSGIGSFIGAGMSAIDQVGTQEAHFGSNGDLLRVKRLYSQLHFYEVNPRLDQVQAIDNFFDMYGYTINRHWNIANFTNNRSNWNYVKTQNADLRVFAPADYEQIMKNIFDSGVRIWHKYDEYADYSEENR